MSGSGVSKSPEGHFCSRLFLAPTHALRASADAKVKAGILETEARSKSGKRRPKQETINAVGLEDTNDLGMPAR